MDFKRKSMPKYDAFDRGLLLQQNPEIPKYYEVYNAICELLENEDNFSNVEGYGILFLDEDLIEYFYELIESVEGFLKMRTVPLYFQRWERLPIGKDQRKEINKEYCRMEAVTKSNIQQYLLKLQLKLRLSESNDWNLATLRESLDAEKTTLKSENVQLKKKMLELQEEKGIPLSTIKKIVTDTEIEYIKEEMIKRHGHEGEATKPLEDLFAVLDSEKGLTNAELRKNRTPSAVTMSLKDFAGEEGEEKVLVKTFSGSKGECRYTPNWRVIRKIYLGENVEEEE